ncbi:hypothetical protein RJ639_034321 [Escallonia herrerae]|uniref:Reverse transcriptase Ty1/copia-type domain-containing protein n=1 Tax=Escallonia herrerae TaxID=1293975 RepID=A0AA88WUB2_9ASTE|nr:hypothetical protein RJ639_034321 [Escallonia herrerae]
MSLLNFSLKKLVEAFCKPGRPGTVLVAISSPSHSFSPSPTARHSSSSFSQQQCRYCHELGHAILDCLIRPCRLCRKVALVTSHKTVLAILKNGARIPAQLDPETGQWIDRKVGRLFELINLSIPHRPTIPLQSAASTTSPNSLELWHLRLGSDLDGISTLKQDLNHHFEMKDLGTLSYFLRLEVFTASDGYHLSQAKYASDLLSRAGLTDSKTTSPLEPNVLFLMGTLFHGLHISAHSPLELHEYSDADWAGDPTD